MRFGYVNKANTIAWHALAVAQGIAAILDGAVMAATFGFAGLGLQLEVAKLRARYGIAVLKARESKKAR